MYTKKIIAITTITTIATAGLANAQTLNLTDAQKNIFEQAMSLFRSGKSDEAKTLLDKNNLKPGFGKMMGNRHGKGKGGKNGPKNDNRKAMHDAIASGNYTEFQRLASTTPMAKIDQNTFKALTPHFAALKNAKTNIENILKSAGIERPEQGNR
jgi:hypothetical protein